MNGVTNSVLRVIDHLDGHGHDVQVIAPGPGPSYVRSARGSPIAVHRVRGLKVPMYGSLRFGFAAARRIHALMTSFRPDLVHLAAPTILGRTVGEVAFRRRVPSVALFQTDLSGFLTEYGFAMAAAPTWRWLRGIHNRANLTLAPTQAVATGLRLQGFERVGVWGRGVDHLQFHPDRRSSAFRARCGVTRSNDTLVGYVGRLASEKRVDRLRHLARHQGVRLVIVGDGPERGSLERILPDATFTGFLGGEELGEAMASLDVFVHTGEHETFGQTIQEAMASGVAVVAPAAGGPLDLVEPGRTGLLYGLGDEAELGQHVHRLTVDRAERKRIAKAGMSAVSERSWRVVGDELLDHYDHICGRTVAVA